MQKLSFGQRMMAYPARRRLVGAITISVIGIGIVLLQVVPPALLTQGVTWLSTFLAQLGALDPHLLFSVLGGALILSGVFLSLLPALRRTYFAYPPRVAPVSVYFDYENQSIAATKIPAFAAFIEEALGSSRRDCFFYTDDALSPNKGYLALHRYGFRMIQVTHKGKKLGSTNAKNMVDMELALHAFERAMLTRERQHIVIIAADRDYLPLLYRLRALGHDVSIWARTLPSAILDLHNEIGITCVEFGAQFNEYTPEKTSLATAMPPATPVSPPAAPAPPAAMLPLPVSASASEVLADVIERTLRYWQEANQKPAENQYAVFLLFLTTKAHLEQIGFSQHYHARHWATVLKNVGVLAQAKQGAMYARSKMSVAQGTAILTQFLEALITSTQAIARSTPNGIVDLSQLRRQLKQNAKQSSSDVSKLYTLMNESSYCLYLLACARALSLIEYTEVDPQHIQVQVASTPELASPDYRKDEPARE